MPFSYPTTILLADSEKVTDISELVKAVNWSGSYKQVSRTLAVDMLYAPNDLNIPHVPVSGGMALTMSGADGDLFAGTVLDLSRETSAPVASLTAYDWGIYLKRNEEYIKVEKRTAEEVTSEICRKIGLTVGSIAKTGILLNRNFFPGNYYEIIRTLYALASEQTGGKYMIRIIGRTLSVIDVLKPEKMLLLKAGSNLIDFKIKESASNLTNSVGIYDDNNKLIDSISDSALTALYGVMQQAIQKSKQDDATAAARKLIDDGKVATTITATCIGNPLLLAGNSVIVEEPITKTFGQFYILTDNHSWNSGMYKTKLTLQLEAVVDAATAGAAVKEA